MNTFTIQHISTDIFLIRESFFSECANMFLIQGSPKELLIDTGTGTLNLAAYLLKYGYQPRVFLTHAHFDHADGAADFPVEDVLVTDRVLANLREEKLRGLEYRSEQFFEPSAFISPRVTVQVKETYNKETVTVGAYSFQIIPAPGHTDDSVILHDAKHKLLISGDALYDGEMYADLPNSNKADFAATLKMMRDLPFETVLPGHNAVMDRGRALEVIDSWLSCLTV